MSLDGFIAGEGDDLSWLPPPPPPGSSDAGADGGFGAFLAEVGAIVMGRRTFDVVAGFEGPWPYGDRPVFVATHRPLPSVTATARAAAGSIDTIVAQARTAAAPLDVYLDGGQLIRQALEAGLVDLVTVAVVGVVLGQGVPLFAGVQTRRELELVSVQPLPRGLVQLTYQAKPHELTSSERGATSPTGDLQP
jgi:dihydrofolate reductase